MVAPPVYEPMIYYWLIRFHSPPPLPDRCAAPMGQKETSLHQALPVSRRRPVYSVEEDEAHSLLVVTNLPKQT